MRIESTNLDEKALPDTDQFELYKVLQEIRALQKLKQAHAEQADVDQVMKDEDIESKLVIAIKKLVDSSLWKAPRIQLSNLADIFNAVGERLEKWQEIKSRDELILWLSAASMIVSKSIYDSTTKIENMQDIIDIVQKSEDVLAVALAMSILDIIPCKTLSKLGARIDYFALGSNLLRDAQHHFTLSNYATGANNKAESLKNSDLKFDYEIEPQGLNERVQVKSVVISRDEIVSSPKSAEELSKEISGQYNKASDEDFRIALEVKIILCRYIVDDQTVKDAFLLRLNSILLQSTTKRTEPNAQLTSYLKDSFINESIDVITSWSDTEKMIKVLSTINKILSRDQLGLVSIDPFLKVNRAAESEDQDEEPLVVQLLNDITIFREQQPNAGEQQQQVSPQTKLINIEVAKNGEFQMSLLNIAIMVIKQTQQINNRQSQQQIDLISNIIERLIRIVEQNVNSNFTYCYSIKLQHMACTLLKSLVRSRHEEPLNIVHRFEKRIVYEIDHLEDKFQFQDAYGKMQQVEQKDRQVVLRGLFQILGDIVQRDVNNTGISRKVMESQVLGKVVAICELNTEEKGEQVDEFIVKSIVLVGMICYESPTNVPTLIKNGIIPAVFKSLERRLPNSTDMLTGLIQSLHQVIMHQEGQDLFKNTKLFEKIIESAMDEKLCKQVVQSDQMTIRQYLCSFYDRNAEFKETTKKVITVFIDKIKTTAQDLAVQYIKITRQSDLSQKEKQTEIAKLKDDKQLQQANGGLFMILILCALQNDRVNQSRHTADIITEDIFNQLLEVYQIFAITEIPSSNGVIQKIIKFLSEQQNVQSYVKIFVDHIKSSIKKLSALLGPQLEKVKNLNSIRQVSDAPMLELGQLNFNNIQNVLNKPELFQTSIKIIEQYVKTFLTIPSPTKQIIVSTFEFDNEIRTLFYFQKILFQERSDLFLEAVNQLNQSEEPKTEGLKTYKSALLGIQVKDEAKTDTLTKNQQMQEFLDAYIDTQGLQVKKDLQMFDFINKIASYSSSGNRSARGQRQDIQKKNCLIIGKYIYKMTKGLRTKKSAKIPIELNNQSLLQYLFQVQLTLNEINNCLNKRQLDGLSFYEFYKSGGLNNLLETFQWLSGVLQVINLEWQRVFNYLFEESCYKIKEILVGIIQMSKIDNSQNAFLDINMTNEFDSPKHFFSNVFNSFCQNLLLNNTESENPLVKTYKENFPYLQDVITQLLLWASQNFGHCIYIKESQRADQRGRARNQPDPNTVQNLVDMGFTREQASAALLQHGSLELAAEYLLQNAFAPSDNFQNVVDNLGRASSDESDEQQTGTDMVNYETSAAAFEKAEKTKKVTIDLFKENTHKVQLRGFDWILEAQNLEKVSNIKAKELIQNTLILEKEPEAQKSMFKKLSDSLKKSISVFESKVLITFQGEQSSLLSSEADQPMEESKESSESTQKSLFIRLYYDLQLLQKIIIKEKKYSKESIRQDLYKECSSLLEKILKITKSDSFTKWIIKDKTNSQQMQIIIFELLLLQFTMIQFVALDIIAAQSEIKKKIDPKLQAEVTQQREKKNKEYKTRVNPVSAFEVCLKILNLSIQNQQDEERFTFQKPIIILSIVLLLKGITDEDLQKEKKADLISQAFDILSKIKVMDGVDIKLVTSFTLFSFQEPVVNQQTFEKLIQRVLALKFDDATEQLKKQKKSLPEEENSLSSVSYPQFLNYFKLLANRDRAVFQKAMSNICEVKATKKEGKIVNETASVRIKSQVLQEHNKQQLKERPLLRQLIKTADIQNDTQFKKYSKLSKTALQTQCTDDISKTLNILLNNLFEATKFEFLGINQYFELSSQKQAYIVAGDSNQSSIQEALKSLELLSSLSMAYPLVTVAVLQHQFPNKKSFIQWFLQEFMVCSLLQKKSVQQPQEEGSQISKHEISYEFKSDFSSLDSSVAKILNLISGYNHLLSFNETLVKFELRQKLITEATLTLQKAIKSKKSINPLKQRAAIASCLIVVDSLINYEFMASSKLTFAAKDNYYNSIRALIVRDGASSQANPPSFIKVANELMTDTVDVTSKLNAEIIRKTISIFKTLSNFINQQKKKLKNKEKQKKPELQGEAGSSGQPGEEQKDNVVMAIENNENISQDDHMANEDQDEEEEDNNFEDEGDDNVQEDQQEDEDEDEEDEDESALDDQYNEGEEEDEDEDIDQFDYRLGGDADIQDDMESDDEEFLLESRIYVDDRRAHQQQDIVAINDRDILNILQMQNHPQGNRRIIYQDARGGRQNDWSQEEQEVQRLLINMRGMLSQRQQAQPGPGDPLFRNRDNQPDAGAPQKNLIEQMFESLNTISEQEILELVLKQRQKIETENAQKVASAAIDVPSQPQLLRREVIQPAIDINMGRMFGNEDAHIISIQERLGDIQMLLNQHQQNIIDPLYGRPWQFLGGPGIIAPAGGAALAQNSLQSASDLGLFSRLLRNSQQNAQDNINDQLLNNEDITIIEAEEQKDQKQTSVIEEQRARVEQRGQEQRDVMRRQQEEMAAQREGLMQQHSQFQQSFLNSGLPQPAQAEAVPQIQLDDQLFQSLTNSLFQQSLNTEQQQPRTQQQLQLQPPNPSLQPDAQLPVLPSLNQQLQLQQEAVARQSQNSDQVMEEVLQQPLPSLIQQQPTIPNQPTQQPEAVVQNEPIEEVKEEAKVESIEEPKEEQKQGESQESEKPAEQVVATSGKTFGYDNELLLANDIDPAILHELPEDVRAELLSSIDVQVQQQLSQQNSQQQQQPEQLNEVSSLADPNPSVAEEQKNNSTSQQQTASQSQVVNNNQSNYAQIASELGLDPTFLESIPEEFRRELIDNELMMRNRNLGQQQQQQQPHREPEQMDLASFIATVTDPILRAEILTGLDEASLAQLPPNLMAEARRIHDQARSSQHERLLVRQMMQGGGHGGQVYSYAHPASGGRAGQWGNHHGGRLMEDLFARNPHRGGDQLDLQVPGELTLDQIISKRHRDLAEEQDIDESAFQLQSQLGSDEKLIDSLLVILCGNDSTECQLIPLLDSLIKIQSSNGQLAIRNKIINAITFILRCLALDEQEALKIMLPNVTINKNKVSLLLIGTLRIMIRNNKKLIQHILKGLINKEDYFKQQGNHTLKRQQKAILVLKATQVSQPSLAEIFSLVKAEMFKQDKVLMKNLSILIHQILKQFDVVIEDLGAQSQQISKESVESLAEILSLEIIDFNLMSALGEFLYQVSKKKRQNFELISEYCESRSNKLLDKLNDKLEGVGFKYENLKVRLSPNRSISQTEYSQHDKNQEEEKVGESQIDTSAVQTQVKHLKLSDEEEKSLKQALKITEDSEVLLRIFKLFNLFYEKFSAQESEQIKISETQEVPQKEEVIQRIKKQYSSPQLTLFVQLMNDVLRIIQNANIEIQDSVSNLIFCVFASFFPEVSESQKKEDIKDQAEETSKNKYSVTMIPIGESLAKNHAEKFVLFKKFIQVTPRLQELSRFCQKNKKVINKLIKNKNNVLINEMDYLIKYMPNLLDFENKRGHFKLELAKLKKSQYHEQIHLFIRRDDIFMDSYAQLNIRTAAEMKGKLHISFTGERGQDAGGLTRDFFIELSREIFNPNYSLFNLSSNGSAYFPNPRSYVEKDHLRYFKFIGRVIGKALLDECLLECYFVKSLYKVMTGEALNFYDLEDFDNEFFTGLKWCLDNDVETMMATFSIEQDFFGKTEEIELIEGGKKIAVTNQNKNEYVEKLTYFKLYKSIQKQIDAFLEGFYELIPKELVSIFNYKELELLISGLPNFDIDDLKANTEYQGYQANSPQVQWLWEILESFENSERAEFLQFVTGSSKVPVEGFRGLMGMRGPQKFTIAKIKTDDLLRLPSGHTCFNQIDIPEYPSKEIMHERVMVAIKETKGFGFA